MPDAVKLDTAFGSYATSYEVKDGALVFRRKLVQRATTIPVEQYNSVRSFFERIRAAEQAPVVLIRKVKDPPDGITRSRSFCRHGHCLWQFRAAARALHNP